MRRFFYSLSKIRNSVADFKNISQTPSTVSQKGVQQTAADQFKLSWSHYLKLIWIDDEKEQLSTSKLSVSEIAYLLSFEHPSSFKKLYKPKT